MEVYTSVSSTMWIKISYVICYFISYYNTTKWVWTLGLWAVVNNAGINFHGDLEFCLMAVVDTDCTNTCQSNYNTIMATTPIPM
jgi:hypothetical protein